MKTQRNFSIGGCDVQLVFKDEVLETVQLPKNVPASFDRKSLRQLVREISKYKTSAPKASDFRRRVWERMSQIPSGEVMTYSDLAAAIGRPKAVRAVGSAVGANHLLLVVPCHRVVAKRGLGGFRIGLAWKRKLLELEAAQPA
jgi:O-6-methylguanine DNA methyltransferase